MRLIPYHIKSLQLHRLLSAAFVHVSMASSPRAREKIQNTVSGSTITVQDLRGRLMLRTHANIMTRRRWPVIHHGMSAPTMLSAWLLIPISSPLPPRFSFAALAGDLSAFATLSSLLGLSISTGLRAGVHVIGRVTILQALITLVCVLTVPPQWAVTGVESLTNPDPCAIGREPAVDYQLCCTTLALIDPGLNGSRGCRNYGRSR